MRELNDHEKIAFNQICDYAIKYVGVTDDYSTLRNILYFKEKISIKDEEKTDQE